MQVVRSLRPIKQGSTLLEVWLMSRVLPSTRQGRLRAAKKDPVGFVDKCIREMGSFEIQKLILALHATIGLTPDETEEETREFYARWRDSRKAFVEESRQETSGSGI